MNLTEKLPDEILLKEILVKLPRNSLRSSSSVCKPWHDLVTRNYFSEKHSESKKIKNAETRVFLKWVDFKNNKLEDKYSIISNNQPFERPALEPFHIPKTKTLAGSCNGIICLAPIGENPVLYNPITQHHRVLPPGFLGEAYNKIHYRFQLLGFGFDESTNDYKVVRICFDHSKTNRYAEIYRLSANCWRKIECKNIPILDYITFHHHPNGVFLNGVVHWVVDPYFKIFTFDFESEVFGEIECVNPGLKHVCNFLAFLH